MQKQLKWLNTNLNDQIWKSFVTSSSRFDLLQLWISFESSGLVFQQQKTPTCLVSGLHCWTLSWESLPDTKNKTKTQKSDLVSIIKWDQRTAILWTSKAFLAPFSTSNIHLRRTLFSGWCSQISERTLCIALTAVPHSFIKTIPSPVVQAFHPKTLFSCSLRADTSQPVSSRSSGSILNSKKVAKADSAVVFSGSCRGRLSIRSLSLSRMWLLKSLWERRSMWRTLSVKGEEGRKCWFKAF